MMGRQERTRNATLRAVRTMVALRLVGREIGSPERERVNATEDTPHPLNPVSDLRASSSPTPLSGPDDRAERVERVRPPIDVARFRRALIEAGDQAKAARAKAPGALPMATSREECPRCGIPGFRGCEHQAPFVAAKAEELGYDYKRAGQ